jgi:hypothetical protein
MTVIGTLLFQYSPCIENCKWILENCFDGSPDVDDLEARFYESFAFFTRELRFDELGGIGVALINMHATDGALELGWDGILPNFLS